MHLFIFQSKKQIKGKFSNWATVLLIKYTLREMAKNVFQFRIQQNICVAANKCSKYVMTTFIVPSVRDGLKITQFCQVNSPQQKQLNRNIIINNNNDYCSHKEAAITYYIVLVPNLLMAADFSISISFFYATHSEIMNTTQIN